MDHIQEEIAQALREGAAGRRKGPRFSVRAESGDYAVLRLWEGGFAVAERDAPRLGGFVDLMAGDELLARCLIVLSEDEGDGVVRYEYKRRTDAADGPAADYAAPEDAPVALLA